MPVSRSVLVALALLPALGAAASEDGPQGYLRFPTLSDDRIAFTAEDDIWWVDTSGGPARRLTHAPGLELMPQWSPDGRLLAYTASSDGNQEVRVIPREGGASRRLTTHPSQDQVLGWTPGGRVIFRSRRDSVHGEWRAYTVAPDGGRPEPIPVDVAALVDVDDDGDEVAFTRFSLEFRTWKRYLGGWQQDIWHGRLSTGKFTRLTSYPGSDAFARFWGDRLVFLSDRSGTGNLWSLRTDGTDLRQHTFHEDHDVRWPDVHGDRAVYMHAGDLLLLDLPTGRSHRVAITLPTDLARARPARVDVAEGLTAFELSRDGTRVVAASRGEIATLPVKAGRTIEITGNRSSAHERDPSFSPDGRRVAFLSDDGGEWTVFTAPADGTAPPARLTKPGTAHPFAPAWSPDGTRLAYGNSDLELVVADAKTGATRIADTSDFGEIREVAWSPDGRFLAYAKPVAHETSAVFLWSAKDGTTRPVTSSWVSSFSPAWDPDGKYLYLLADGTVNPIIGRVDFESVLVEMTRPYVLVLAAGDAGPFFPKAEEAPAGDEKGGMEDRPARDRPGRSGTGPRGTALPEVKIDFEGLASRLIAFPVPAGHLAGLRAAGDHVTWLERDTKGLVDDDSFGAGPAFDARIVAFPLDPEAKREPTTLAEDVADYDVTPDGRRLLWREKGGLRWRDGLGAPGGDEGDDTQSIDLSAWPLAVDRRVEWNQIFEEAWRLQREFYFDPGLAGVDWTAARARYAALLPRITTREELNDLIGQLIGELSTGHAYVWGGDVEAPERVGIGLLGARLEPDAECDCHRFAHVFAGEPWEDRGASPATLPQAGVKDGTFLLAINGRRLRAADDPHERLVGLDEKVVSLTLNSRPTERGARTVEIVTTGDEGRLRYLDWVDGRRRRVDELSGGRIGYIHVPDMGADGLVAFMSTFFPQLDKEALVIDVRDNGGGFVSQLILGRLRRVLWASDQPRHGRPATVPYRVFTGPMAALCNQGTGSDGDVFAESFQILGLGPVIGTRTWGGVVGIRADKPFVDGGMSTQPEYAWWERRRGYGLENEGVLPDVVVDNEPSEVLAGRDPQLEKAVELLLASLTAPVVPPSPGPVPDKSRERFREQQRPWLHRP